MKRYGFLLWLVLGLSALAWGEIRITPDAPTTSDEVYATVSYLAPTGGYGIDEVAVRRQGRQFEVDVDLHGPAPDDAVTQATELHEHTESLGRLGNGQYTVHATYHGVEVPDESVSFNVSPSDTGRAVSLPFEDGLENMAVGDYPGENGWVVMFDGVSAYVSDAMAHGGNKSFRLESAPSWSRTEYVPLGALPERLTCEVSVYPDPTPDRSVYVGFPVARGSQGPFFNRIAINSGDGTIGVVLFTPRGSGSDTTNLGQFEVGTWCTVRATFDFKNLTADLWLNGQPVADDVTILPREFDTPDYGRVVLDKWGVSQRNWHGGGTGVIYIDDVVLRTERTGPGRITQLQDTTTGLTNAIDLMHGHQNGSSQQNLVIDIGPAPEPEVGTPEWFEWWRQEHAPESPSDPPVAMPTPPSEPEFGSPEWFEQWRQEHLPVSPADPADGLPGIEVVHKPWSDVSSVKEGISQVSIAPARPTSESEVSATVWGWKSDSRCEVDYTDLQTAGNDIWLDVYWRGPLAPTPTMGSPVTQSQDSDGAMSQQSGGTVTVYDLTPFEGVPYQVKESLGTFAPGAYTLHVVNHGPVPGSASTTFIVRDAASAIGFKKQGDENAWSWLLSH